MKAAFRKLLMLELGIGWPLILILLIGAATVWYLTSEAHYLNSAPRP